MKKKTLFLLGLTVMLCLCSCGNEAVEVETPIPNAVEDTTPSLNLPTTNVDTSEKIKEDVVSKKEYTLSDLTSILSDDYEISYTEGDYTFHIGVFDNQHNLYTKVEDSLYQAEFGYYLIGNNFYANCTEPNSEFAVHSVVDPTLAIFHDDQMLLNTNISTENFRSIETENNVEFMGDTYDKVTLIYRDIASETSDITSTVYTDYTDVYYFSPITNKCDYVQSNDILYSISYEEMQTPDWFANATDIEDTEVVSYLINFAQLIETDLDIEDDSTEETQDIDDVAVQDIALSLVGEDLPKNELGLTDSDMVQLQQELENLGYSLEDILDY